MSRVSLKWSKYSRFRAATVTGVTATGGVNRLMDYIFFQMQAINGFDGVSHYLRAGLILNACSTYATKVVAPDCRATFDKNASSSSASSASSSTGDPVLDATHAGILKALNGEKVGAPVNGKTPSAKQPSLFQRFLAFANPNVKRQRQAALNRIKQGAGQGSSPALGQSDAALNYLLGP